MLSVDVAILTEQGMTLELVSLLIFAMHGYLLINYEV